MIDENGIDEEEMGMRAHLKKLPVFWVAAVVVFFLVGSLGVYYFYQQYLRSPNDLVDKLTPTKTPILTTPLKLDPQKEKTHLSKIANTKGVYFVRGFDLYWDDVEIKKGKLDWSLTDEQVRWANKEEIYPLVMVKPFAIWDQENCHPEKKYDAEFNPKKGKRIKVGKPCDLASFGRFLEQAVERYDGDGVDDMPDLLIPIKYWEIMNEPEMQGGVTGGMGEELKFFVGTPQDYLDILKTSYQAIKKADREANVLHAGMAGMERNFQDFWQPVFEKGGGQYFDIANIHTISTDQNREDLFVIKFKGFLQEFGLQDRPIWITEVQFGSLANKPRDLRTFEILMAKASVFALSQGADKLFYISNWTDFWGGNKEEKTPEEKMLQEEVPKEKMLEGKKKLEVNPEVFSSSTHKVYLNLVNKINQFDRVQTIKEDFIESQNEHNGAISRIGQYKFIFGDKSIHVLWGEAELPAEISGQVKVTNIYGQVELMDASLIKLGNAPIFIELE